MLPERLPNLSGFLEPGVGGTGTHGLGVEEEALAYPLGLIERRPR